MGVGGRPGKGTCKRSSFPCRGHSRERYRAHSCGAAIEVYRNKVLIYGCGDFIDDYEGIRGREEFREDLVSMCVTTVRLADGALACLETVPLPIGNMRLNPVSDTDRARLWRGSIENVHASQRRPA
jgi:poly-gamma-glutamate capsule biosynthesis protein CapA/YwtB (metallophosphatase superfamily)